MNLESKQSWIETLALAARTINEGGVVAYPTESCYGLGCDPRCKDAVQRVLRLKQRPFTKGLILIAAAPSQLTVYLQTNPVLIAKAAQSWPGPTTWLLPVSDWVPVWLRGNHETIAVRVTRHRLANALCRKTRRAIVSTSANRQSRPPATSTLAVTTEFGDKVDYILEGPIGGLRQPTKIINAETDEIIRQ